MEEEIDYTGEKVIPNYCKSKLYYLFIEIILWYDKPKETQWIIFRYQMIEIRNKF
jgi:hypothetical protein